MRTWMKNGARMTVVATAFAAAGAGLAFSHTGSSARLTVGAPASHAVIRLTAAQASPGCSDDESTNPANIPASNTKDENDESALGAADPGAETTNPANIPAANQADDEECGFSTFASLPSSGNGTGSGHHGSGSGHHHHGGGSGSGSGSGSGHHGSGAGHHGSGAGHHGSGAGHHGSGAGHHGSGAGSTGGSGMGGHGKYHHHPAGGMGASTGASQAGGASSSASASSSSSASDVDDTLPTTGAPIAGLLGLAVAVLAAGLVARRLTRRDAESQPEEA